MYAVKWSVMQYVIVSPCTLFLCPLSVLNAHPWVVLCIVGLISEAFGVLCPQIYSVHFTQVYITSIDFVTIRCINHMHSVQRVFNMLK